MQSLVQPDRLRARIILLWAEEETRLKQLPAKSGRQARCIVSSLIDRGVLASASLRAPLRLAFPANLAARWMPGLFPEKS